MEENTNFDYIYKPIKAEMKRLISPVIYTTYIESLVPVGVDGRTIILQTPSMGFMKAISERIAQEINDAIISANVGISAFRLVVAGDNSDSLTFGEDGFVTAPAGATSQLNPNYTFDSFVVGKNNEFVYAAALSVANDPAGTYNPLFIYGGTGLGKTHLIQAIAHKILAEKPSKNVIYVTCEQFFNEIIDSMFVTKGPGAREKGAKLRKFYRSADVLIIDDIQFISNKSSVQEEFFHTFNELVSKGKQIVITSDKPPKDLPALEERLKTRFSGGLVFDVTPPNFETKIAILKRKAYEKNERVPDDVLAFLAQDSGDDVRTLEGRLSKVIFAARLHEEPISIELAKIALSEAVSERDDSEDVSTDSILNTVAEFYHIEKKDLVGKSKKKDVSIPRQVCCYIMCELLTLPLVSIGQILGGRDHTTILYSRDKIAQMITVNDKIAKDVDDIKSMILKK